MQTEPTAAPGTAASPTEVVLAFFAAMEAADLEAGAAFFADDVVYQNVPLPAYRGKPAVLRALRGFQRFVTGFEVRMRNIAERDGVVLTERVDVLSGPFVYLDIWVCGTFEVKNGKITLWRDYFDLAECTGKLLVGPLRKLFKRGR